MIRIGRALPLLWALCAGCAHAPPRSSSDAADEQLLGGSGAALPPGHPRLPPGHPPVGTGGRPGPGHGLRAGRGFPFPLRDGRSGDPLSAGSLQSRLEAARVVYAGEHHTDAASHDVQLALLGRLFALDRGVAVGVEMLPREAQPVLDAYLAGKLDEEAFLREVRWDDRWGYDFGFYRPIFSFCRAHGLRIFALNAPQELVRSVRRGGVEGLSAAERAALPGGYPWPQPEAHRAYLREVFSQHAHMGQGDGKPAASKGADGQGAGKPAAGQGASEPAAGKGDGKSAASKGADGQGASKGADGQGAGKPAAGQGDGKPAASKGADGQGAGKPGAGKPASAGTLEERFVRFYLAQLVWDETMAESVARALAGPAAPRRLLVLAGSGHVGVHAVPARAARRGAEPSLTVAPTDETSGPPPGGAAAVDILAVVSD